MMDDSSDADEAAPTSFLKILHERDQLFEAVVWRRACIAEARRTLAEADELLSRIEKPLLGDEPERTFDK